MDERELDQLRPVRMQADFIPSTPGSVLIEWGNTRVICTATMDERNAPFRAGSGLGWLTAEYDMLPGSTDKRKSRSRNKVDGRSTEIQRLIGRSLRSVMDFEALGERSIYIDCDVIQADGGTRTASITGGYVALVLACKAWMANGVITHWPIRQGVAAVSVGIVKDTPRLDLMYAEDSQAQVDMNVVMTEDGCLVEVQGTGEERPFTRSEFDTLLLLAEKGIGELLAMQKEVIEAARV
jgi:ribonuclease PH